MSTPYGGSSTGASPAFATNTPLRPPRTPSSLISSDGVHTEPEEHARKRFTLELEFVQCLANPQYLQFLAQQQYFCSPSFLNYLAYLRYWGTPEYAKHITYPYALHILELLQHPWFRHACAGPDMTRFIHEKEYHHWKVYRKNRIAEGHEAINLEPPSLEPSSMA
ncbi:hypothetical protein HKX48_005336 [Thoreauomyces humboldtii]|nr:hypothetical protein HKX48_005336 [Thoreauomyces humboldtii]